MNYSIVYSSQTGNTAMLARQLKESLSACDLLYFGAADVHAQKADLLFVGFWTDKGSSDRLASDFLKTLRGKQVFLFGTAGFGGSEEYFAKILAAAKTNLDSSNSLVGSYLCQGKMPLAVRRRYEAMQAQQPKKMQELIENFDRALSHPDRVDLDNFIQAARNGMQTQRENRG